MMKYLAILLISQQVYLLSHTQAIDGQEDDTVTIEGFRPLATTSPKLAPAVTQSTPDVYNGAEFYVIGGIEVGRLYPWIVSIRDKKAGKHLCAGSLITPRSVLTTASCFSMQRPGNIIVVLGNDQFSAVNDTTTKLVTNIKYHENFSSNTFENDIAIVTLVGPPLQMGRNIRTVTLGTRKIVSETEATMVGWGSPGYSPALVDQLRHVNVNIMSNSNCSTNYQQTIFPQQLCAGMPGRNACTGDNGGPLMQNGVQIGVFSYISDCISLPGVYTRVASYLTWINKNKS